MPAAIDPSMPAPFTFDRSVVFVCVDVESYERAHDKITEIGIATLDTRDLDGLAPGNDGENWRLKVRARHFRIEQYKHLRNHEFVHGCPDRFDFGTSEFCSLEDAAAKVGACFKPPFCALPQEGAEGAFIAMMEEIDLGEQRNIIFLGHDTLSDVRYLQQLGFNPLNLPNLLELQDTATMYRVWRREPNPTNLGKILYDFDIAGFNLHNAGNDAVFTVQSMLAICVREATIRGSSEQEIMHNENQAARLAALTEDAQQKAKEDAEGWSDADENNDGGAPEGIVIKEQPPKPTSTPTNLRVKSKDAVTFDAPSPTQGRGRGRGQKFNPTNIFSTRGTTIQTRGGYGSPDGYRGPSVDRYRHQGRPRAQSGDHGYDHGYRGRGRGRGVGRGGGRARARGSSLAPSSSDGGFLHDQHEVRFDLINLH